MNKNQGFTLTELLVVVLIIGILSAVALPQYQKAVEKARMAEAVTAVESIAKANQLYYLANGMYATDLNDLDISFNGEDGLYGNSIPNKIGNYFIFTAGAWGGADRIALASRRQNAGDTNGESVYSLVISRDGSRKCAVYRNATDYQRQLCSEWAGGNVTVWE